MVCLTGVPVWEVAAQTAPAPSRVLKHHPDPNGVYYLGAVESSVREILAKGMDRLEVLAHAPEDASAPVVTRETVGDSEGSWILVRFAEFDLGNTGELLIVSRSDPGQSQIFTQETLLAWGGQSAIFNGGEVDIVLRRSAGESDVFYRIEEMVVGEYVERARSLPEDSTGAAGPQSAEAEALCGVDNRIRSTDNRLGRIMPIGCTGWSIENGVYLTAGHCMGANMAMLQFEVPASDPDGTPNHPDIDRQFRIIAASIVGVDDGIGNDWAVFRVLPNSQGKTPDEIYGAFSLTRTNPSGGVWVRGYGLDDSPAGAPPSLRNADSQIQQQHSGPLVEVNASNPDRPFVRHRADTRGGNSGGPIFSVAAPGEAIGIHTHGGCNTSSTSANHGTSFTHDLLWAEIEKHGEID